MELNNQINYDNKLNKDIIFENNLLINLLNKKFNKNAIIYYKFKYVYARQTKYIGEIIETITNDGLETKNQTKSTRDYIIKNQTFANEQYILTNEEFNNRYELVSNEDNYNYNNNNNNKDIQDEFNWLLYKPKSTSQIKAIKINKKLLTYLINKYHDQKQNQNINQIIKKKNLIFKFFNSFKLKRQINNYQFYLIAKWGEKMIFKENDYLVIPRNLESPNIYRIANKEFFETYKKL